VQTVVSVNEDRKSSMAARVSDALGGNVSEKRIGVLGLAFKPNTDDMRDAPVVPLVRSLLEQGASVIAFDPAAMKHAEPLLPGIALANNAVEVTGGADALVVVTDWDEFRGLDLDGLANRMRGNALID
jgi:UDPglucose 6-dehydrogenase